MQQPKNMFSVKMGPNSSVNADTYTMGDQMSHDQNGAQYYNVNAMDPMCRKDLPPNYQLQNGQFTVGMQSMDQISGQHNDERPETGNFEDEQQPIDLQYEG